MALFYRIGDARVLCPTSPTMPLHFMSNLWSHTGHVYCVPLLWQFHAILCQTYEVRQGTCTVSHFSDNAAPFYVKLMKSYRARVLCPTSLTIPRHFMSNIWSETGHVYCVPLLRQCRTILCQIFEVRLTSVVKRYSHSCAERLFATKRTTFSWCSCITHTN